MVIEKKNLQLPFLILTQIEFMRTAVLLFISNIFMTTTAWYWHLKFKETILWKVVIISWLIAFLEYCVAVPANRIGSYQFNAFELKTIQEVVSLTVFVGFAILYLKECVIEETTIAGLKRLRILKDRIRLKFYDLKDCIIKIGCALHNLRGCLKFHGKRKSVSKFVFLRHKFTYHVSNRHYRSDCYGVGYIYG